METASDANSAPNPNHDAPRQSPPSFCPRPLSGPNVSGFSPTQKNTTRLDSNGRPPSDGQLPTEHAGLNHPLVIPEPPSRHSCPPPASFLRPFRLSRESGNPEGSGGGATPSLPAQPPRGPAPRRARTLITVFPAKAGIQRGQEEGLPHRRQRTRPGAPARSPLITVFPAKAGIQRGREEGLPHGARTASTRHGRSGALAHSSPSFPRKRESRGVGKRGYPIAARTASTRPGARRARTLITGALAHPIITVSGALHHRLSRESGNPEGSGRGATPPSPPARPPRGPAPRHARTWRGSWPSSPARPPRLARSSAPPPSPPPAGRHGAPSTYRGCP